MEILGLVFAGTATPHRPAMSAFVADVLRLAPRAGTVAGQGDADHFTLPDGSGFAVADEREPGGGTSRTIGFLVADLDAAAADLRAHGVEVDEPAADDVSRYAHFVAPDGRLYELVERGQGAAS